MRAHHILVLALSLVACKADDPAGAVDAPTAIDGPTADAPTDGPPADGNPACQPLTTDYMPRVNNSADDMWPVCISDQDQYVNVDSNVSTIARIRAFEVIAALLFVFPDVPSNQDFIDARTRYSVANGLGSRVDRREDEHYPAAPMACNAAMPFDPTLYPDRCIGPVKLKPLIFDNSLVRGQTETDPLQRRLAAARVEAGLLYFLYISVYKEAVTCKNTPADCDSSWAYYSGGYQRNDGIGLARYIRGLETQTHDRTFDGILALRCWRNLDDPTNAADDAMFDMFRNLALGQLDRSALRAVTLILKARIVALQGSTGDNALVHWEMIRHLGPVLLREATVRDAAMAAVLTTEFARTDVTMVDEAAIINALDAIFDCP